MPAGIASSKEPRFISISPSKFMTSCCCAKKAAMMIPKRPPRPNTSHCRLLLRRLDNFFNFEAGTRAKGSPSLSLKVGFGEGALDGSEEESPSTRRLRVPSVDILESSEVSEEEEEIRAKGMGSRALGCYYRTAR